jgi:hypothetical protein
MAFEKSKLGGLFDIVKYVGGRGSLAPGLSTAPVGCRSGED